MSEDFKKEDYPHPYMWEIKQFLKNKTCRELADKVKLSPPTILKMRGATPEDNIMPQSINKMWQYMQSLENDK